MPTEETAAPPRTITRSRLADQAYEWLKDQILTRRLLPGARLSVPAIATELGLSRSPVREAVQRLVQEGLCDERPHQGAVVAAADLRSLADLYQVRSALEGLSAELAVGAGDQTLAADLTEIQQAHQAAFDAGQSAEVIRNDLRFHRRLLVAAGNPQLERVLDPIFQQMTLAMLAGSPSWSARAVVEHQEVLDAVQVGDAAGAAARLRAHVDRVRRSMLEKIEAES